MYVARLSSEDTSHEPKRAKLDRPLVMGFSDVDKIGTIQPHDDALVITLRIWGYDVRRVMVNQGSATEIMYPDLYKGLGLKAEDPENFFSNRILAPPTRERRADRVP